MNINNISKFLIRKNNFIFFLMLFFAFNFVSCSNNRNLTELPANLTNGFIVSDEPQASVVGVNILNNGGSAADAVVASFFILSVTYPVAAGIGAGGVCIVHDSKTGISESIDFRNLPIAEGSFIGIPRAVRALSGLQARYGQLKWSKIVLPAEKIARFGFNASRSTSKIAKNYSNLPGIQNFIPFVIDDIPINEGAKIKQNDLAETLAKLRTRGGGDLYFGELGKRFSSNVRKYGINTNFEKMRDFQPSWESTKKYYTDKLTILTPFQGTTASKTSAYMIKNLYENSKNKEEKNKVDYLKMVHLSGEISFNGYIDRLSNKITLPKNEKDLQNLTKKYDYPNLNIWRNAGHDGTTSIVALDKYGLSVACGFSMGSPYGLAKKIEGLGFSPGIAVDQNSKSWLESGVDFLAPLIITDRSGKNIVFSVVGSKGPSASTALSLFVVNSLINDSLEKAINIPRVYYPIVPNEVWFEEGLNLKDKDILKKEGYQIKESSKISHINAIFCPKKSSNISSCQYISDPRGTGIGLSGEIF